MAKEAAGMAALGLTFDLILTSPLRRAQQTARIVADRLGLGKAVRVCQEAGPGCRLSEVAPVLGRCGDSVARVLVVGHQPDMGRLAADLVGAREPFGFGRGTLACLESATWPPAVPCGMLFLIPGEALERIG
jgi:phosphohistidine phosphatase